MYYFIEEEDDILIEERNPNELVSKLNLWASLDKVSGNITEGQVCPLCGEMVTNFHWGPKKTARLDTCRFPDYIFGGDGPIFSEKVKLAIESNNLKGIKSFNKIEIVGKNIPPYNYFDTIVAFADCEINWNLSKIPQKHIRKYSDCVLCGRFIDHADRIVINETKFFDFDIFQLYYMPYRFIVSEKFVNVAKESRFSNMSFIPMVEYSF